VFSYFYILFLDSFQEAEQAIGKDIIVGHFNLVHKKINIWTKGSKWEKKNLNLMIPVLKKRWLPNDERSFAPFAASGNKS